MQAKNVGEYSVNRNGLLARESKEETRKNFTGRKKKPKMFVVALRFYYFRNSSLSLWSTVTSSNQYCTSEQAKFWQFSRQCWFHLIPSNAHGTHGLFQSTPGVAEFLNVLPRFSKQIARPNHAPPISLWGCTRPVRAKAGTQIYYIDQITPNGREEYQSKMVDADLCSSIVHFYEIGCKTFLTVIRVFKSCTWICAPASNWGTTHCTASSDMSGWHRTSHDAITVWVHPVGLWPMYFVCPSRQPRPIVSCNTTT